MLFHLDIIDFYLRFWTTSGNSSTIVLAATGLTAAVSPPETARNANSLCKASLESF